MYAESFKVICRFDITFFSAIIWANAYATKRLAVLYLAQFLMGCGSGSLGVTRAYVVESCEPKDRTDILSIMTALQYAGFTVSPAFGSLLSSVGNLSGLHNIYYIRKL